MESSIIMVVKIFKELGGRLDEQSEKLEILTKRKYEAPLNRDEEYKN